VEFTADEWENLAPSQRAKRCRTLADECEVLADTAAPDLKAGYRDLSRQWAMLADEIERILSPAH
jgi:hypothetical protein